MIIPFYKYQGTGNDFVIIDHFHEKYIDVADHETIRLICDRKFGVGADGLILLEPSAESDFTMIYFNADGLEGSLCGNGSRCAVACMHHLGRFGSQGTFLAADGLHRARVNSNGDVNLKMSNLENIEQGRDFYVLNTGSPHYVAFVEDLSDLDIVQSGRAIRYSERFTKEGINVNFVEESGEGVEVSTYERGVEDETLSCGTGVTAAALAHAIKNQISSGPTKIKTKGGSLEVRFTYKEGRFSNIWLCGPAQLVFEGQFIKTSL
jgi:diaminopimelate epimerase